MKKKKKKNNKNKKKKILLSGSLRACPDSVCSVVSSQLFPGSLIRMVYNVIMVSEEISLQYVDMYPVGLNFHILSIMVSILNSFYLHFFYGSSRHV
jgi:hypothetical protein